MSEKQTPSAVRTGFEKSAHQMREGLQKHLPPDATLVIKGMPWTQAQLVQQMQDAERLYAEVRDARTLLRQKLLDRQRNVLPHAELHADLALALKAYFGRTSAKLSDLGIRAGQRTHRSGPAKTLAQAKSRLTRAARHTMGKKQKLAIKPKGNPSLVILGPDGTPLLGTLPPVAPNGSSPLMVSPSPAKPGGVSNHDHSPSG